LTFSFSSAIRATITMMNAWMTRVPSASIVSARFWSSIAESSWAVPSFASRSNRARTMPRTRSRAARRATRPATTMKKMGPMGLTRYGQNSSRRTGTA
jgi:hypothetical protein